MQATISGYERHKVDGSFPPLVRNSMKEPKLQFAKEFLATQEGSASPEAFKLAIEHARKIVLDAAIKHKKDELQHLTSLTALDEKTWKERCFSTVKSISEGNGGQATVNARGTLDATGLPDTAKQEFTLLWDACGVYTYRCLTLARASIDRTELQKLSKIQIKEVTDVDMTDIGKELSVRDQIREEMKSLKREIAQTIVQGRNAKPNGRVTKSSPPNRNKGNGKTKKAKTNGNGKRSQKRRSQ